MLLRALIAAMAAVLLGCGQAPEEPSVDPAGENAYEGYRMGLFAIDTASRSLEYALRTAEEMAKGLRGDAKEDMATVVEMIDGSGAALAELDTEAPELAAFEAERARFDQLLARSIEVASEARIELRDAAGMVDGLAETGVAGAEDLAAQLHEVVETLEEAVGNLGGQPEPDGE